MRASWHSVWSWMKHPGCDMQGTHALSQFPPPILSPCLISLLKTNVPSLIAFHFLYSSLCVTSTFASQAEVMQGRPVSGVFPLISASPTLSFLFPSISEGGGTWGGERRALFMAAWLRVLSCISLLLTLSLVRKRDGTGAQDGTLVWDTMIHGGGRLQST